MSKLLLLCLYFAGNFYSLSLPSVNAPINLSDYRGKKVLIVNTASNSKYAGQYASLEQLYQRYKDSLVIIAVPCNDFGNEPGDDSAIQNIVTASYSIHYLLASKTTATGDSAHPLFQWLTKQEQNGVANTAIKDDFQKYLVDANGNITGIFASSVDPMSAEMLNAFEPQNSQNQ